MGNCHPDRCHPARERRADIEEPSVVKMVDQLPPLFEAFESEANTASSAPRELTLDEPIDEARNETIQKVLEPLSKDEQLMHVLHSEGIFMMLNFMEGALETQRSPPRRPSRENVSIPKNLMESQRRNSKELTRITRISLGSGDEVAYGILESNSLSNSCVAAIILDQSALGKQVRGMPVFEYLTRVKQLVSFGALHDNLAESDCAEVLDAFAGAGALGAERRAGICEGSEQAVTRLVERQFVFAKLISDKGLMPLLRIEVMPECPDRDRCEKFLLEALLHNLRKLKPTHPGVLLSLSCPVRTNTYLPLLGHPKVLRIAAHDVAASHAETCKALTQNLGLGAYLHGRDGFLDSFEQFQEASRPSPAREQQLVRVSIQDGFFVGLDHTATTARSALKLYGVDLPSECSDNHVFEAIHEMRSRIFRDPVFCGDRIIGAILSEDSLERRIDGIPTAQYLWERRRVVPILRLFQNLAPEKNGVQMMKQVSKIDALLDRAARFGIYGTKMRSIIRLPKESGIKAAVAQQFSVARTIMAKGLVPVLQIEIDINSPNKVRCERLLYDALMDGLENLRQYERVVLDLTVPSTPNTYLPLISHPNAIRVTSLSGGLSCQDACALLSQNVGLVASFGRAFIEELRCSMSDEDFSQKLDEAAVTLFNASVAVPTKEMQLIKVTSTDGIFAPRDKTGSDLIKVLQRYGEKVDDDTKPEAVRKASEKMRARILTNPKFNGSVVIAVTLAHESLKHKIDGDPVAKYVWEQKNIVPFVKMSTGLRATSHGVQLMSDMPQLDRWLSDARRAGVFGTKMRSVIKQANSVGIKEIVKQHFEFSKRVFANGLVPILMPEVDIKADNKDECEHILCDELLEGLGRLRADERVIFWLTLPNQGNKYLPLIHHPNVIRVVALSGGYSHEEATQMLAENVSMVGGFERGLFSDIKVDQSEDDFTKSLDTSMKAIFDASRRSSAREEQMIKMGAQDGFVAAFDQNQKALPEILQNYGFQRSSYQNEKVMNDKVFEMFTRVLTNSKFNGSRVLGIVIRDDFLDRDIEYTPCAKYLWEHKHIVPFLKLAKGLQPEKDGVQLMKDVGQLDRILDKAADAGVFGTKARSVIKKPNSHGIHSVIEQQFEIVKYVLARGMVPIMHIEVDLDAENKPSCERMLRQALMGVLRQLEGTQQKVMFQVTLPSTPNAYASLVGHPNVIRVCAPSGGYTNAEACDRLVENPGMIASFGRALIQDLHVSQTDREYTQLLDRSCREVYDASRGTARKRVSRAATMSPQTTPRTTPRGAMVSPQTTPRKSPRTTPRLERDEAALGG